MKSWASFSSRNACFNYELLSSSSRISRSLITAGVGLVQALFTSIHVRLKTQPFSLRFQKKIRVNS